MSSDGLAVASCLTPSVISLVSQNIWRFWYFPFTFRRDKKDASSKCAISISFPIPNRFLPREKLHLPFELLLWWHAPIRWSSLAYALALECAFQPTIYIHCPVVLEFSPFLISNSVCFLALQLDAWCRISRPCSLLQAFIRATSCYIRRLWSFSPITSLKYCIY